MVEISNKTFGRGSDHELSACVGNNGIQDLQALGFGYDEAVKLLIKAALDNESTIDVTIYPLVFCARHRIELFLKDHLLKFNKIRNLNNDNLNFIKKTHDLSILWSRFSEQGEKIDRRLQDFIVDAGEYINDYAEIDPTGQAFRYPYTKSDKLHLEEISTINIGRFAIRFFELSKLMEAFEHQIYDLIEEYTHGVHTAQLSRQDLYEISKKLPPKSHWLEDSFNDVKNEIKAEYNLSSRKLSEAIDIITNHREFCINIGLEIPLPDITSSDIKILSRLRKQFEEDHNQQDWWRTNPDGTKIFKFTKNYLLRPYGRIVHEYTEKLKNKLTKQTIITIYTLVELGRDSYFCEEFDLLFHSFTRMASDSSNFQEYCGNLFSLFEVLKYLKSGLEKTGQVSLLAACF